MQFRLWAETSTECVISGSDVTLDDVREGVIIEENGNNSLRPTSRRDDNDDSHHGEVTSEVSVGNSEVDKVEEEKVEDTSGCWVVFLLASFVNF